MIDNTSIVYKNVKLGDNVIVQPFVILGMMPTDKDETLSIGNGSIIRSHTVIYANSTIGEKFNCGHGVRIRECVQIGNNTQIGTNSQLEGYCKIGNNVKIHTNVHIGQNSVIEDDVFIAPGVVLTNVLHPLCPSAKECMKGATIKKGVKIGANSTINPGVTIHENVLIGSGSVVVGDVAKDSVVVGNPAKVVKNIYELECPFGIVERPYLRNED